VATPLLPKDTSHLGSSCSTSCAQCALWRNTCGGWRRTVDAVPLGGEPLRYYELAQLNEESQPSRIDPALRGRDGTSETVPLLPKHPAGSGDLTLLTFRDLDGL
jgi:hypothetical protein